MCKRGLLFPSSLAGGWEGGTQILLKKLEDSLSVKLCGVYVTPFPLFHEFFRAVSISLPLLFFFFFVELNLEQPKECPCRVGEVGRSGGGGARRIVRRRGGEGRRKCSWEAFE